MYNLQFFGYKCSVTDIFLTASPCVLLEDYCKDMMTCWRAERRSWSCSQSHECKTNYTDRRNRIYNCWIHADYVPLYQSSQKIKPKHNITNSIVTMTFKYNSIFKFLLARDRCEIILIFTETQSLPWYNFATFTNNNCYYCIIKGKIFACNVLFNKNEHF